MWINLHAVFLIFACLLLLGCGPPDRGLSEVVRWDSAGVTMVSNPDGHPLITQNSPHIMRMNDFVIEGDGPTLFFWM